MSLTENVEGGESGKVRGLRSIPQGHLIAFVDFFGFVSFRGVSNSQEPLNCVCVTHTGDYRGYAEGEGEEWSFWDAPDTR